MYCEIKFPNVESEESESWNVTAARYPIVKFSITGAFLVPTADSSNMKRLFPSMNSIDSVMNYLPIRFDNFWMLVNQS